MKAARYPLKGVTVAQTQPAYMEMVDFIANGTTPDQVVNYRPSPAVQRRVSELLEKNNAGVLSEDDQTELDHYLELEHIFRMAKIRAREILAGAG
jgi:hypothetical protein